MKRSFVCVLAAMMIMALATSAMAVQKARSQAQGNAARARQQGGEGSNNSVRGVSYDLLPEESQACFKADRNYPEFTGMQVEAKGSPAATTELKKLLVWRNIVQGEAQEQRSKYNVSTQFAKNIEGVMGIMFGTELTTLPGFNIDKPQWKLTDYKSKEGCTGGNERYVFVRDGEFSLAKVHMTPSAQGIQYGGWDWASITPPEPAKEDAPKEELGFFGRLGAMASKPASKDFMMQESKVSELYGVQVRNIGYLFDENYKFVGLRSDLNTRKSFDVNPDLQQAADVFDSAVKELGPPTVIYKNGVRRVGVWITGNGIRVDVSCSSKGNDQKNCSKGEVQVRQLPAPLNAGSSEGASKFFE